MFTVREADCWKLNASKHATRSGEVLDNGTMVVCRETRSAKNGKGRVFLVRTNIFDSYTRTDAWVKYGDLQPVVA